MLKHTVTWFTFAVISGFLPFTIRLNVKSYVMSVKFLLILRIVWFFILLQVFNCKNLCRLFLNNQKVLCRNSCATNIAHTFIVAWQKSNILHCALFLLKHWVLQIAIDARCIRMNITQYAAFKWWISFNLSIFPICISEGTNNLHTRVAVCWTTFHIHLCQNTLRTPEGLFVKNPCTTKLSKLRLECVRNNLLLTWDKLIKQNNTFLSDSRREILFINIIPSQYIIQFLNLKGVFDVNTHLKLLS